MNTTSPQSIPGSSTRAPGVVTACLGFACVVGGAAGAHDVVPADNLEAFTTGMHFGQIHSVAALAALILARQGLPGAIRACWLFITGIVLFSGSLAVLGLTQIPIPGLVTPMGGLSFLAGWGFLAAAFFQER